MRVYFLFFACAKSWMCACHRKVELCGHSHRSSLVVVVWVDSRGCVVLWGVGAHESSCVWKHVVALCCGCGMSGGRGCEETFRLKIQKKFQTNFYLWLGNDSLRVSLPP